MFTSFVERGLHEGDFYCQLFSYSTVPSLTQGSRVTMAFIRLLPFFVKIVWQGGRNANLRAINDDCFKLKLLDRERYLTFPDVAEEILVSFSFCLIGYTPRGQF